MTTEAYGVCANDQLAAVHSKRPQLSCTKCKNRKVKVRIPKTTLKSPLRMEYYWQHVRQCDRVQSCQACGVHGHPSDCIYLLLPEVYQPRKQSDEIKKLRDAVEKLKSTASKNCRINRCVMVRVFNIPQKELFSITS